MDEVSPLLTLPSRKDISIMLEEIVCLGSNVPDDRTNEYHVMGERNHALRRHDLIDRIVGIILHIERSGENAAYNLVFKRENSSVVQIGRRSGQDSDKCHDGTSAMFRCAVVSRKHAKIVFSDGGHVSLLTFGKSSLTYLVGVHYRFRIASWNSHSQSRRLLSPNAETRNIDLAQ